MTTREQREAAIKADRELVKDLCEVDDWLTEWEIRFCESIANVVLDRGRELTERQRATARTILDRLEK